MLKVLFVIWLFFIYSLAQAQEKNGLTVSGSIQSDVLFPQDDEEIGAAHYKEWGLTNSYADVMLQSRYVDAGARFEFLKHPLPGYEKDFAGWGIPNFFVKAHTDKVELTGGSVYDQFGSGFIFRTYEERSLGVDNALFGGRLVYRPMEGLMVKVLT